MGREGGGEGVGWEGGVGWCGGGVVVGVVVRRGGRRGKEGGEGREEGDHTVPVTEPLFHKLLSTARSCRRQHTLKEV